MMLQTRVHSKWDDYIDRIHKPGTLGYARKLLVLANLPVRVEAPDCSAVVLTIRYSMGGNGSPRDKMWASRFGVVAAKRKEEGIFDLAIVCGSLEQAAKCSRELAQEGWTIYRESWEEYSRPQFVR